MSSNTSYGKTVWDAAAYDAPRRRLVPSFDLLYQTAANAVRDAVTDTTRPVILDLGAGTGLLSERMGTAAPDARLHLLDGSPDMLDAARQRLRSHAQLGVTVQDLTAPLPTGPFDAIVSGLAIHHLGDAEKRALFGGVFAALKPGGLFVNVEQLLGPTPALERQYAAAHEAFARAHGSDDAEWAQAEERMKADRCSTLDEQLQWLREAGFIDVDCLAKDVRFGTYVGRRPGIA